MTRMERSKPYKVILWGPGYTGSQALREIARRPELELVGCLAYSAAKAGRDAMELVGEPPCGVQVTTDKDAVYGLDADVVLVSHDGDFVDQVSALCDGSRQVGVIGFTEFVNAQFRNLPGLRIFDLEYDLGAFNTPLPRVRIIPIDQFDPLEFL